MTLSIFKNPSETILRKLTTHLRAYYMGTKPLWSFEGCTESDATHVIGNIFDGLGYLVNYEFDYPENTKKHKSRCDLIVCDPIKRWENKYERNCDPKKSDDSETWIEVKWLYDKHDNRLREGRDELQKDFAGIRSMVENGARGYIVWIVLSECKELTEAQESSIPKVMERLEVKNGPTWAESVDLNRFFGSEDLGEWVKSKYRYLHCLTFKL